MMPPNYQYEGNSVAKVQKPFGIAYALQPDGSFRELWRTEGWYTFEAFISEDGRYLVRMGPWNAGHKPASDHLAVAFYDNGRLLEEYSTADLVQDPASVRASVSHYTWLRRDRPGNWDPSAPPVDEAGPYLTYRNRFILTTSDNIRYTFDVQTGRILETKKMPQGAAASP